MSRFLNATTSPARSRRASRPTACAHPRCTPLCSSHLSHLLQVLYLAGNNLGSAGAALLACHLGLLSGLQSLDLSRNQLTPAATWVIAPDIARLPALLRLSLASNPLGVANAASWKVLRDTIGPNPHPGGPQYKYPAPTAYAEHARDVAMYMKMLGNTLEHLDLTSTGLCPISGRALALQLPRMTALKTLNITGNAMEFGRSKPNLTTLHNLCALRLASVVSHSLTRPRAESQPIPRGWWSFLPQLSALAVLDLHGFDMASFPGLAPHLASCSALKVLILGGGERAFCAESLASALQSLTTLEFLNLNNSHLLEPTGEEALARTLNRLPNLRAISLSWGLFPDERGQPLVLNLAALSRAFALDLSDTLEEWGPAEARPLAKKLRRLPRLLVVNISHAWCDAGAVAALHAEDKSLAKVAATRMSVRDLTDVAIGALLKGRAVLPAIGAQPAQP
jgi:hypothetical protein